MHAPLRSDGRLRDRQPRRGAVAAQFAICLAAVLGVTAIALDGGILLAERRHAQATADAVALSAAALLFKNNNGPNPGLDPGGTIRTQAAGMGTLNGYNDGNSIILPNALDGNGKPLHGIWIPPITGDHVGQAGYVEVVVQFNQAPYFSSLWATDTMPVKFRAVARGNYGAGNAAFVALAPTGVNLNITGSASVNVPNGTATLDSTSANALTQQSSGSATAAGGWYLMGGITGSGTVSPTPVTKITTPLPDPLASIPTPTAGTPVSSATGWTAGSAGHPWKPTGSSGTYSLSAGTYTGGIDVGGSASVTLAAGFYYFNGPLTFHSSGTLDGTSGVTIYVAPGNASNGIDISNATLKINPPSTGPYQGVSIFEDRTSTAKINLNGGANWNVEGAVYGASAPVSITGPSGVGSDIRGAEIVAASFTVSGSGTINLGGVNTSRPKTVRQFQLVE